ncbi:peptidylprolyl isomerase [Shimia sp. W99]
MSKHLKFLRSAGFALLIATPSLAQEDPDIKTVVASVNGHEITLGEVIAVRGSLPEQYRQLPPNVLFEGILNQLVQQAALSQTMKGPVPDAVEIALKNERRSLLAGVALTAFLKGLEISDAEVQAAYDAKYADFQGAEEYNASHILVETEEEANAIRESLMAGADFAETAKAKSTGPSGPSGGSLGWFGAGQMVKPFEDAVVNLAVGEISMPVQTQFGWHLIILNDKRQQEAPSFESEREELVAQLQTEAVDAHIAELVTGAEVDRSGAEQFDPSVILRGDLLDSE